MTWVLVVIALYSSDGGAYHIHTEKFRTQTGCEQAAQGLMNGSRSWTDVHKVHAFCVKDG